MGVSLDRNLDRKSGSGHKDVRYTFTAAATKTDVVAGVSTKRIIADRLVVANTTASAITVHMEDGGTEKGPTLQCPANDTTETSSIVVFDAGAGLDVQSTGACTVYLDYHRKAAGL